MVIIRAASKLLLAERISWCSRFFEACPEVHGHIQAELHRCCWENIGFGLVALYFQNSDDHLLYLLKFP